MDDETIAQLLVTEGFSLVEEVAYVPAEELAGIEGFNEDVAAELARRAVEFLERRDAELTAQRRELGVSDDIAAIERLSPHLLVLLGQGGVKTLDDLGDLASDELLEMLPDSGLSQEEANEIIMAARAHWFDDEPEPETPSEEAAGEEGSAESDEAAGEEGSAESDEAAAAETPPEPQEGDA